MTQSQAPRRSAFRSIRQNPCTSHRTSRFSGPPPNRYSPWILRLDGSGREIISRILRGRTQPSTRSCFVDTREDANPPKIRTNMTSLRGGLQDASLHWFWDGENSVSATAPFQIAARGRSVAAQARPPSRAITGCKRPGRGATHHRNPA